VVYDPAVIAVGEMEEALKRANTYRKTFTPEYGTGR